MPEPAYKVIIDPMHLPFAIVLEDPSYRAPFMVRITWMPSDAQSRLLCPDWINKQPAIGMRNYDKGNTSRWFIRAREYGFRDVELETHKEGTREIKHQIPAPKTRTRGRWFAWEGGQWVNKPNHAHHLECFVRDRKEYWHTPSWEPGQDMTPIPPLDPEYRKQKEPL